MTLYCLLPAAGASSRMRGGDKLLEDVGGAPCLRVMARRAIEAGLSVIVTLPSKTHPRAKALLGLPVQTLIVPNARCGMSASLAAGALAVPKSSDGLMILPADMPALQAGDLSDMANAFRTRRPKLLRARTAWGKPGHPILFAPELLGGFWHLTGDEGAQRIVKTNAADTAFFDFSDERARLDLDTPEDWAAWRASLIG